MSRDADIEAVLSYIDPDVKTQATPDPDGCRIIVEVNGQTHRFSIGKRPLRSAELPPDWRRHLTRSDPEQASAVRRQALNLSVRLTSARSVRCVLDVVRMLRPQADVRLSRTSPRRYASGCPPQQGVLHPDDGDRA